MRYGVMRLASEEHSRGGNGSSCLAGHNAGLRPLDTAWRPASGYPTAQGGASNAHAAQLAVPSQRSSSAAHTRTLESDWCLPCAAARPARPALHCATLSPAYPPGWAPQPAALRPPCGCAAPCRSMPLPAAPPHQSAAHARACGPATGAAARVRDVRPGWPATPPVREHACVARLLAFRKAASGREQVARDRCAQRARRLAGLPARRAARLAGQLERRSNVALPTRTRSSGIVSACGCFGGLGHGGGAGHLRDVAGSAAPSPGCSAVRESRGCDSHGSCDLPAADTCQGCI